MTMLSRTLVIKEEVVLTEGVRESSESVFPMGANRY